MKTKADTQQADSTQTLLSNETESLISQELIVRFVMGDKEAFAHVFDKLQISLFWIVRRYFKGAFDQEEAMQEIWIKLYRMRDRFDVNRHETFVPWARQVARNQCLDLLKAKGRGLMAGSLSTEASCPPTQHELLEEKSAQEIMSRFVSQLDIEQQKFFHLCFVEEHPHEAIAQTLKISERRSKYLKKKLLGRMMQSASLRILWET